MAVLTHVSHIRGKTKPCIRYIQDEGKIVPGGQTMRVIKYFQSHAISDVMSVGYNGCSGLRDVACEQFKAAEERYHDIHPQRQRQTTRISTEQYLKSNHKKTLPPHIHPDADGMITVTKEEVTAEHLVISCHKDDKVTPELMQRVLDEFMRHEYFKDFPALSNLHWDTDEPHAHILISNYATDGSHKLCLSGTRLRELRRYLDKICYAHGLSIIDSKEARLDPAHSEWLDSVLAEGRVKVWSAKQHRSEGLKTASEPRKKSLLELIAEAKAISEAPNVADHLYKRQKTQSVLERFFRKGIGHEQVTINSTKDYKIQAMVDALYTAKDLNIRTPAELSERALEIGAAIGETRRAIAYQQRVLGLPDLTALDGLSVSEGSYSTLEKKRLKRLSEACTRLEDLSRDYRRVKKAIGTLQMQEERGR